MIANPQVVSEITARAAEDPQGDSRPRPKWGVSPTLVGEVQSAIRVEALDQGFDPSETPVHFSESTLD